MFIVVVSPSKNKLDRLIIYKYLITMFYLAQTAYKQTIFSDIKKQNCVLPIVFYVSCLADLKRLVGVFLFEPYLSFQNSPWKIVFN